jgi:hypothetical protein
MYLSVVLMPDPTSYIQIEHVWLWSDISDLCFESRIWNPMGYRICPIDQTRLTQIGYIRFGAGFMALQSDRNVQ